MYRPSIPRLHAGPRVGAALAVAATLAIGAAIPACDGNGGSTATPDGGLCAAASASGAEVGTIFQGGSGGYPVYRIPSIAQARDGTLVAFTEGRQSFSDPGAGRIDVVMRRSTDCGTTWAPLRVVADNGEGDAHNPTSVVVTDPSGRESLWLFYAVRPRSAGGERDIEAGIGPQAAHVLLVTSDDAGLSWSAPRDLTAQFKDPAWRITSPGPGGAIQVRWGNTRAPAGRVLVPGWFTTSTDGDEEGEGIGDGVQILRFEN